MKTTTKASINQQVRNIGIDVGKAHLHIYILELDRHWQIHNVASEIKSLIAQFSAVMKSEIRPINSKKYVISETYWQESGS